MANEIDELMDKDPLELSAQDLDAIIAYQRKQKANFDAGIKPTKGGSDGPVKIDLVALGLAKAPEVIKRRI